MQPRFVERAADAPKVVRFLDDAWASFALSVLPALPERTDVIDEFAICAEVGGDLIGVAVGKADGGVAELEELIVDEAWRGQGVGTRLLQSFEEHARKLGAHKTRIKTLEGGEQEAFYRARGYEIEARARRDFMELDWVWLARFWSCGPI